MKYIMRYKIQGGDRESVSDEISGELTDLGALEFLVEVLKRKPLPLNAGTEQVPKYGDFQIVRVDGTPEAPVETVIVQNVNYW